MKELLINQIFSLLIIYAFQYIAGLLVEKKNLLVNYSRKIVHFISLLAPLILAGIIKSKSNYSIASFFAAIIVNSLILIIFLEPIRKNSKVLSTIFAAIDRPEDRPHTLIWLFTQLIAGYLVMAPFFIIFQNNNMMELAAIPVIILGIGDGFAEPIGIKYGKHKYKVTALFTKKKYYRSVEGSACVLVTAVISVLLFSSYFTMPQLLLALAAVPVTTTIAEAISPHTWDTPFILLTGFAVLYLIKLV
nr:hypothetical protein [uncultured Clostridium sp.]